MKEWKIELAEAIINDWESTRCHCCPATGESDRVVRFKTIANENGFKHVKTADIRDIVNQIKRINPDLHAICFLEPWKSQAVQSTFNTLYITDLEFEA